MWHSALPHAFSVEIRWQTWYDDDAIEASLVWDVTYPDTLTSSHLDRAITGPGAKLCQMKQVAQIRGTVGC